MADDAAAPGGWCWMPARFRLEDPRSPRTTRANPPSGGRSSWRSSRRRSKAPIASSDGRTLAVRSDVNGGRVFVIRGGRLVNAIASAADDIALPLERRTSLLALTAGDQLKWYSTTRPDSPGAFTADAFVQNLPIDVDGQAGTSSAARSERSTCWMPQARSLWQHDCAGPSDRSVATRGDCCCSWRRGWAMSSDSMGSFIHSGPRTSDRRRVTFVGCFSLRDPTPTSRVESWGNAAAVTGVSLFPTC